MGTWNALYFRGELPGDFRPDVEGACPLRRLGAFTELALPGVDDGEGSALALSKMLPGDVLWVIVQTAASVVGVTHCENGNVKRRIVFADGSWRQVTGEPQPWEARLFSDEALEAAKEVGDVEGDAELERAFATKVLKVGDSLPWPREWETLRYALGVSEAEWRATRESEPFRTVEGRATSKLTHFARGMLALGVGSLLARLRWPANGLTALTSTALLLAFVTGYVRRSALGRWFL